VRSAAALVVGFLWTALMGLASILAWPLTPRGRIQNGVMRVWGRGVLALAGLRRDVAGAANARGGPFVVVANHSSMLDIPAVAAVVPGPFRFVSRPFFFKIPILGWGMRAAGNLSLDPKKPRQAAEVMPRIAALLRRGVSVVLFPEGTRTRDGRLQRYRRGPFLIAIENGVPVLPVCLSGLFDALDKGSWRVRPGSLLVEIGAPVPTAGLGREEARALAERIGASTRETLERLASRSPAS